MKQLIIGGIFALLATIGIVTAIVSSNRQQDVAPAGENMVKTEQSEENKVNARNVPKNKISMEELKEHNKADDCWTVIRGNVYDISEYVPRHPGGDEILRACGNEGTSLFEQRQTEDGEIVGSGTPHSMNAASLLQRYIKGVLVN